MIISSIAQRIKNIIEVDCSECFSLHAGYGMKNGDYIRWPSGKLLRARRDLNGRCIYAEYIYSDDSRLLYKYNSVHKTYSLIIK